MLYKYEIIPQRPFSLKRTAARLARYPECVDRFDNEVYRRLLFIEDSPLLVEVCQAGSTSRAVLEVLLTGERSRQVETKEKVNQILENVFAVSADLRPFYRRFRTDALLGPLIRKHSGLRIVGRASLWDTLLQTVLSQQINLTLAHEILGDISKKFGQSAKINGERFFVFPTTERFASLSEAELHGMRLSRAKATTLIRLAEAFELGTISEEQVDGMKDQDAIEFLMTFKGVGRWTAEFVLLRGLSRWNVFPGGDLGVIKHLAQRILGFERLGTEDEMRRYAEAWSPYRGLALMYVYAEML